MPESTVHRESMADAGVEVSVCCATFNHRAYIGEALESILGQNVPFSFEVLVHDDASTDGTRDIVADYAGRYPGVVIPVLQDRNQYASIPVIVPRFLFPLVRGRYVAFCEGDDYWTDDGKLARQHAAMESSAETSLSFHPVDIVERGTVAGRAGHLGRADSRVIPFERVLLGGGGYCPTPSLMIRRSVIDDITSCLQEAPFGDKFIQIIGSHPGGALYLPETMAAHRRGHSGAWSGSLGDAARLKRTEELVSAPYAWLRARFPAAVQDLLRFSEGDQFAVLSRHYMQAGDAAAAMRTLAEAGKRFGDDLVLARIARNAARRRATTRWFGNLYPALRSLYRWRTVGF